MTRCQLMTIVADTQTTGLAVMTKKKGCTASVRTQII